MFTGFEYMPISSFLLYFTKLLQRKTKTQFTGHSVIPDFLAYNGNWGPSRILNWSLTAVKGMIRFSCLHTRIHVYLTLNYKSHMYAIKFAQEKGWAWMLVNA